MKNLLRLHVERHRQDRSASDDVVEIENMFNKKIGRRITQTKYQNLKKRSTSPFIDNNQGTYLADMILISNRFRYLLCATDIFSKYAWIIPFKDRKGTTITNAFQKISDESNREPNKICVYKGSFIIDQ